ncbi:MAG: DUF4160 domain-containing protein [Spirochaetes bacterium]|nr:DUF4160 domain-containing protein [Spirochaetota bacterium]
MPEISRFLGIVIYMLYSEHNPPHFHAEYGDYKISVDINNGIVEGKFPKRALKAILEWYEIYKDELLDDWKLSEKHEKLKKIPPLE